MKEQLPAELARRLRSKGFYVSRHANWLIVMKDSKMVALVYVYPLFNEAEVVELEAEAKSVAEELSNLDPEISVRTRKAKHLSEETAH